ncbi:MAG TPA: OB-fold domain-containing protein [Acidimicrobiia bacterium]|nr:OB-fold domain-containing protein [Acidimicrobiia bacterium]
MSTPDAPRPPMPVPNELTQFFWDGVARHELMIQRCQTCGHYIHYPKTICRFCQSRDLAGERVSGRATLYTWTIATQPFHPFFVDRVPYTIATVELAEQPRLMFLSQIVDCPEEDLSAGMPLEVVFEELSPELTLPFFRPARG